MQQGMIGGDNAAAAAGTEVSRGGAQVVPLELGPQKPGCPAGHPDSHLFCKSGAVLIETFLLNRKQD